MKNMKRNFIIFGLGPHAQSCQYAALDALYRSGTAVQVLLLAEMADRRESVENYLRGRSLQPRRIIGLPEEDRNSPEINKVLLEQLEKIKHYVDGVLVCTEPKAHKKYIAWALQNNIDVLTDKPLTAPLINQTGPQQLWQDYLDLEKLLAHSKAKLTLMTNKRLHRAYGALYNALREFVVNWQIPLTHVEISEGGGVWNMPLEFKTRENHPYKYGYGVLLHTGFHFVDLLTYYQEVNHLIGLKEDAVNVHAFGVSPYDVMHQISPSALRKLFPKEDFTQEFEQTPLEEYKQYGMVDVTASLQFLKQGAVITQATLNLLQNTLSCRARRPMADNPYLHNGRLSQNYISVFAGPLFHARLGYFQPDTLPSSGDTYVLEICRNTALVGGHSYQREEFSDLDLSAPGTEPMSVTMQAKLDIIHQWLEGACPATDFAKHKRAVQITERIFEEILKRRKERFS